MTGPAAELHNLPNEKQLFTRMADGDEEAFAEIFFHYTQQVQPFILKMTRSREATEEIVQDVFLSLWLARGKMVEVTNYRAYIYTISNNKTYSWLKKRSREILVMEPIDEKNMDLISSREESIDFKESAALINQAVDMLPSQKKIIFKLSREEGLSHEEIARKLNLSKNTVKNHMVEALRFIREYIRKNTGISISLVAILLRMKC
jgi:RNA polymerase sigma-70 factor (ECF subfamily)